MSVPSSKSGKTSTVLGLVFAGIGAALLVGVAITTANCLPPTEYPTAAVCNAAWHGLIWPAFMVGVLSLVFGIIGFRRSRKSRNIISIVVGAISLLPLLFALTSVVVVILTH